MRISAHTNEKEMSRLHLGVVIVMTFILSLSTLLTCKFFWTFLKFVLNFFIKLSTQTVIHICLVIIVSKRNTSTKVNSPIVNITTGPISNRTTNFWYTDYTYWLKYRILKLWFDFIDRLISALTKLSHVVVVQVFL